MTEKYSAADYTHKESVDAIENAESVEDLLLFDGRAHVIDKYDGPEPTLDNHLGNGEFGETDWDKTRLAPNRKVDVANLFKRRKDLARTALNEKLSDIGDPKAWNLIAKRDKKVAEDELKSMPESAVDEKFYSQEVIDQLHENALAEAKRKGIKIRTPEV